MRALLVSDVHEEFAKWRSENYPRLPDPRTYDCIILLGDCGLGAQGLAWACTFFPEDKQIWFVPGNHEFYRGEYSATLAAIYTYAATKNGRCKVLAPGTIDLGDLLIIGATLWSDGFGLGDDDLELRGPADFRLIARGNRLFSAQDMRDINREEVQFIRDELFRAKSANKKAVVVTHFLPSHECVAERYRGDRLNGYFANNLDSLLDEFKPPIWMFGHSHEKMDVIHSTSGTRMISNAWGYPGELKREYKIIHLYGEDL